MDKVYQAPLQLTRWLFCSRRISCISKYKNIIEQVPKERNRRKRADKNNWKYWIVFSIWNVFARTTFTSVLLHKKFFQTDAQVRLLVISLFISSISMSFFLLETRFSIQVYGNHRRWFDRSTMCQQPVDLSVSVFAWNFTISPSTSHAYIFLEFVSFIRAFQVINLCIFTQCLHGFIHKSIDVRTKWYLSAQMSYFNGLTVHWYEWMGVCVCMSSDELLSYMLA